MSHELQDEYDFDYSQAKPNRFAKPLPPGGRIVYLEPEVAKRFSDSGEVNRLLKAILEALPTTTATQDDVSDSVEATVGSPRLVEPSQATDLANEIVQA